MACNTNTLNTIDARCDNSVGGIKRILIGHKDTVAKINFDQSTGKITDINHVGDPFVEWKFRKNTGSYTSSVSVDPTIGNTVVTTDVNLQFSRAEAQKRLDIQSAINAEAVVIIEDMYGQFILIGEENPVTITSAVMQSGTATTDLSGFTLTFQDIAQEFPRFIDETFDVNELLKMGAQ